MNTSLQASSQDQLIESAFGHPLPELHRAAAVGQAAPALFRAMELRAFLAVTESHVDRVRDRMHQATHPGRDRNELDADDFRMDVQWMEAVLSSRTEIITALTRLLSSMPSREATLPSRLQAAPTASPKANTAKSAARSRHP
ncbi:hypothetical protein OTB20_36170 [Streptomyces sp. H27-H1]|uniref:hypothetical protein n=1 Tax=Streptomyces sp. H27-H1 TaxID=2996461 RepID=UPI00226EAD9C|nr:hypothetical protein [Streptomyces sp. H27-H1]MCY0931529.1 hypothetical protein [Streptomyces sp. H27-H1]